MQLSTHAVYMYDNFVKRILLVEKKTSSRCAAIKMIFVSRKCRHCSSSHTVLMSVIIIRACMPHNYNYTCILREISNCVSVPAKRKHGLTSGKIIIQLRSLQ